MLRALITLLKSLSKRHLVMAQCVLPNTLKNYASSLTHFTKFCDDFHICESDHMPASYFLLSTFVMMHGAGSVGKGAIKTWILGLELWHRINSALGMVAQSYNGLWKGPLS